MSCIYMYNNGLNRNFFKARFFSGSLRFQIFFSLRFTIPFCDCTIVVNLYFDRTFIYSKIFADSVFLLNKYFRSYKILFVILTTIHD
jgi:hypothetical protein